MSKILSTMTQTALVSRHDHLAVEEAILIDNAVHADGEVLARGTLMGIAGGKSRAYAEGVVTGAFSTGAATFTLSGPAKKHFRVGDVIESTAAAALGTILTYSPTTGVGTLTGNSSANLTANGTNAVRIPLATLALADAAGKLLKDEVTMSDTDAVGVGYIEGFFVKSLTTLTAAAMTAMGAITSDTDEARLK